MCIIGPFWCTVSHRDLGSGRRPEPHPRTPPFSTTTNRSCRGLLMDSSCGTAGAGGRCPCMPGASLPRGCFRANRTTGVTAVRDFRAAVPRTVSRLRGSRVRSGACATPDTGYGASGRRGAQRKSVPPVSPNVLPPPVPVRAVPVSQASPPPHPRSKGTGPGRPPLWSAGTRPH